MDVRYINPFVGAVRNLFDTMLTSKVAISSPAIRDNDIRPAALSAIIGFTGDANGTVALCFAKPAATKIASAFAGIELSEDHELADALGELANIVAGQAKAEMHGLDISITVPRVISGDNIRTLGTNKLPVLVLPCDSPLGRFSVEIMVVMKRAAESQQQAAAPAAT